MRQIPSTAGIQSPARSVVDALKENVEDLRSMRGLRITALPASATLADVISKVNEIITRLQG